MKKTSEHRTRLRLAASLAALVILLASCSFPGASQPAASSPAAEEPSPLASESFEIPGSVLTEVAATLFAPFQATWTAEAALAAQAVKPPANTQPAPTQPTEAPTSAPAAQPTPASTQTQSAAPTEALPTVAITVLPTAAITPLATVYQPVLPPAQFVAQSGKAFTVFGLNLHNCEGEYAANFLIENTGSQALESLSLHFIDLTTGQDLYDPMISNAPFSWTDRTCTPDGISRLEPGQWLFSGSMLGPGRLSGHAILANFLFCTQEDLNGQCFPRSVEFVVP
jgi:hypothetical protein